MIKDLVLLKRAVGSRKVNVKQDCHLRASNFQQMTDENAYAGAVRGDFWSNPGPSDIKIVNQFLMITGKSSGIGSSH